MAPIEQSLRQELLQAIETLPAHRLQVALDFVYFLLSRRTAYSVVQPKAETVLDPAQDPLIEFIGGVSHGSLAQTIDEELYSI